MNNRGDSRHPCLILAFVWNGWLMLPLWSTERSAFSYIALIILTIFWDTPLLFNAFHIAARLIASKAFLQSTNSTYRVLHHSKDFSIIMRKVFAWSTQLLFGRKLVPSSSNWSLILSRSLPCIIGKMLYMVLSRVSPLQFLQSFKSPVFW